MCPLCEAGGKVNRLKIYQINFDEAITFCEDDMVRRHSKYCNGDRILLYTGMEISKNFPGAKRASRFEIPVARTKTYGPV